jgi:hypothetical protein
MKRFTLLKTRNPFENGFLDLPKLLIIFKDKL